MTARRSLVVLVAANAVSLAGNVLAMVAVPWFVLETTGSAAKTGLAAFFTTLPLAFGAVLGGTIADRVGPSARERRDRRRKRSGNRCGPVALRT